MRCTIKGGKIKECSAAYEKRLSNHQVRIQVGMRKKARIHPVLTTEWSGLFSLVVDIRVLTPKMPVQFYPSLHTTVCSFPRVCIIPM
jgi:hypothetical protein